MKANELKLGQTVTNELGEILVFVGIDPDGDHIFATRDEDDFILLVGDQTGEFERAQVEPVWTLGFDCGHRLLAKDEVICEGDERLEGELSTNETVRMQWLPIKHGVNQTVAEYIDSFRLLDVQGVRRKVEPTHRPFEDAAEFAPYMNTLLYSLRGDEYVRVSTFDDIFIFVDGTPVDYHDLLNEFVFVPDLYNLKATQPAGVAING